MYIIGGVYPIYPSPLVYAVYAGYPTSLPGGVNVVYRGDNPLNKVYVLKNFYRIFLEKWDDTKVVKIIGVKNF